MKATETNETTGVRLPASVRPEKYILSLKPDLNGFTFQGEESVDIQVTEPVSSITLNASELLRMFLNLLDNVCCDRFLESPDAQVRKYMEVEYPSGKAMSSCAHQYLSGFRRLL